MSSLASLSTGTRHAGTLYFVALLREELGRRIKTARVAAKLSQQELATAIGLKHAQDVSRYERGKVEVPSHRIDLIAEATGRPRSYFVRDPSEPEVTPTAPLEVGALRDALRAELQEIAVRDAERLDRMEAMLAEIRARLLDPPRSGSSEA